ncbi:unnamed protein product [Aphanomyces euteiches]
MKGEIHDRLLLLHVCSPAAGCITIQFHMSRQHKAFPRISFDLVDLPSNNPRHDWDEYIQEYELRWTGGNLGLALTHATPVAVSRVTGKGCPQGIENVRTGDVLLSINGMSTLDLPSFVVLRLLRECPLPATLVFSRPDHATNYFQYSPTKKQPSPRPERLAFYPPNHSVIDVDVTSPKNSKGPIKSPLASRPAAQFAASSTLQAPRMSAPF